MKKLRLFIIVGLIVSCALFSTACSATQLETPKRLSFDDSIYRVNWEMVEAAMAYKLDINGEEYESTRTYFDAASLAPGDYTVKVMATTELSGYKASEWTKSINIRIWPENGLVYEAINGGTEYAIKRADSLYASGDYVIDSTYRGKPVTQISDLAFVRNNKITSVTIPDSITVIGEKAFNACSELKTVNMSDKVTSIGSSAFYGCKSLTTFRVPAGVTTIQSGTFSGCAALTGVDFGDSKVTYIASNAFHNTGLISFKIPDTVISTGEGFLRNNKELQKVEFGNGILAVGQSAFANCVKLSEVNFGTSIKYLYPYAFSGCISITSVTLPESMEIIYSSVFADCSSLSEISLGNGVRSIGSNAFSGTKIVADAPGGIIYVDRWAVGFRNSEDIVLSEQTRLEFAEGTVGIADSAFSTWSVDPTTKELIFPYDVIEELRFNTDGELKYIGMQAFGYMHSLVNLNIYAGIKVIESYAFTGCTSLTTARFANTLEQIGDYAFFGCTKLGTGKVPTSGTFVGEPAISVPDSVTSIGVGAFRSTGAYMSMGKIRYVGNKNNNFLWAVGYQEPASKQDVVVMPDLIIESSTVGIANSAFSGASGAVNPFTQTADPIALELPENLKYLGRAAFSYSSIGSIKFPQSPKFDTIPDYCFYKCNNLTTVTIPEGIKNINRSSFYSNESLVTLEMPDSTEYIGLYAFFRCKSLNFVRFGYNTRTIDGRAFYQCERITSIDLPSELTTIGPRAFYKCDSLSNITFGDKLETIGEYAFSSCKGVESIVLPDSVKTVGDYAFYNCLNNAEIKLNDGLESIGKWAFCNNAAVTTVTIPESVKYVGEHAFRKCSELKNLLIRSSLEVLSKNAFYYSNKVTVYIEGTAAGEKWESGWNSSFRPVVYGCTFSEDGTYVTSINVSTIENPEAIGPVVETGVDEDGFATEKTVYKANFSQPVRAGYEFGGYATTEGGAKEYDSITEVPAGTTVYVLWTVPSEDE